MEVILAIILVIFIVVILNKYLLSFWSRRGFKQLQPRFIFGDMKKMLTLKQSIAEYLSEAYSKSKEHGIVGIYISYIPAILVNDPMLIQSIMIKDFSTFPDRPMPVNGEIDPLSGHLFSIAGSKWRDLRKKLSPTFTSGKLKEMFPIIKNCSLCLEKYLIEKVAEGDDVHDVRDLMARYSIDIIASVGFGIENDCINDPTNIFRKIGIQIFEPNFRNGFRKMIQLLMPKLFYKLGQRAAGAEVEEFISSIVKQTVEFREQNNFSRNDFMQQLIQLKNQGYVSIDSKVENDQKSQESVTKLNLTDLAAQCFIFYSAGFETTSSAMFFCLFELSRNPEALQKVQEELDEVSKNAKSDELTYKTLDQLTYLDCCIMETLRLYPSVPFIFRECSKDYKVPDTKLVISKGTSVFVPLMGLHRDPEIFENPLQFKPERFLNSSNGSGNSNGLFYLPFGDGPRICIGMRLGKFSAKLGLASILSKFNFELTDKEMMNEVLEFHPNQAILNPVKAFNLKVTVR